MGYNKNKISKYHVLPYIRDCFDSFHVEGDQAILEDITSCVRSKGKQLYEESEQIWL